MTIMNRLMVAKNPYMGTAKRVLTVCSGGVLRSPTAAEVLRSEYDYNTRAAGINSDYALIIVDEVLIHWADEIVCMTHEHALRIRAEFDIDNTPCVVLDIPDNFAFRDPTLVELIKERYSAHLNEVPE